MEIEFYPLKLHLVPLILKDVDKISEIYLNIFHSVIENESKENMDSFNYVRSSIENRILDLENFYEDNFGEENIDFIEVARLRLSKLLMFDPFHIKRINEYYSNLLDEVEYEEKYNTLEENTINNEISDTDIDYNNNNNHKNNHTTNKEKYENTHYNEYEKQNLDSRQYYNENYRGDDDYNRNIMNVKNQNRINNIDKQVRDLSGENQMDRKSNINELNKSNLKSLLSIDIYDKPQITTKSIGNNEILDDFVIILTPNEYKYLLYEKAQKIKLS